MFSEKRSVFFQVPFCFCMWPNISVIVEKTYSFASDVFNELSFAYACKSLFSCSLITCILETIPYVYALLLLLWLRNTPCNSLYSFEKHFANEIFPTYTLLNLKQFTWQEFHEVTFWINSVYKRSILNQNKPKNCSGLRKRHHRQK